MSSGLSPPSQPLSGRTSEPAGHTRHAIGQPLQPPCLPCGPLSWVNCVPPLGGLTSWPRSSPRTHSGLCFRSQFGRILWTEPTPLGPFWCHRGSLQGLLVALVTTLERQPGVELSSTGMGRYDGRWQLRGLALLQPSITNFPFHVKKKGLQSCPGTTANPSERAGSRQQASPACPVLADVRGGLLGKGRGWAGGGAGPQSMKRGRCREGSAPRAMPPRRR